MDTTWQGQRDLPAADWVTKVTPGGGGAAVYRGLAIGVLPQPGRGTVPWVGPDSPRQCSGSAIMSAEDRMQLLLLGCVPDRGPEWTRPLEPGGAVVCGAELERAAVAAAPLELSIWVMHGPWVEPWQPVLGLEGS